MDKWKKLSDLNNKYDIDLNNFKNLIVNEEGIIIGTNANYTDDGLSKMCILVASNIPIKYLDCITIKNIKIFIISIEEEKFLDDELKKY